MFASKDLPVGCYDFTRDFSLKKKHGVLYYISSAENVPATTAQRDMRVARMEKEVEVVTK